MLANQYFCSFIPIFHCQLNSLDIVKYTTEIPQEGEEICHVQKAVRHTIFISGQCPDRHRIRWEGGENELLNSQLILKEKMAAYHNILVVCIQGFVFLFHSHQYFLHKTVDCRRGNSIAPWSFCSLCRMVCNLSRRTSQTELLN